MVFTRYELLREVLVPFTIEVLAERNFRKNAIQEMTYHLGPKVIAQPVSAMIGEYISQEVRLLTYLRLTRDIC